MSIEVLDHVQRKARRLVKCLENSRAAAEGAHVVLWRKGGSGGTSSFSTTPFKKGGCSEVDAGLFCSVRTRGNGFKMRHRRFRLDIRKILCTLRWSGTRMG